tara:strand:- start:219 stop:431 length:213 start_codon:yes stop_codon:yes gene_type:complete
LAYHDQEPQVLDVPMPIKLKGSFLLIILLGNILGLGLQANAASPSRIAGGVLIILGLFLINYKSIIRHIN